MARIRSIKPEFFDDPDLAACSFPARLLFVGLWVQADREGRLEYDPRRIKARVFPYDDLDISPLAAELDGADMVRVYAAAGRDYLWVINFTKHQNPHHKEPDSRFPAYSDDARKKLGKTSVGRAGSCSLSLGTGSLSLEGASRAKDGDTKPAAPPVLTYPTIGVPSLWDLQQAQIDEWASLYPGIDVLAECRKALAYVTAGKRKTASGMARFLVGWLNRTANRGGGGAAIGIQSSRPAPGVRTGNNLAELMAFKDAGKDVT